MSSDGVSTTTAGPLGFRTDPWSEAQAASARAGIEVRVLHGIEEMRAASAVLDQIWEAEDGAPQVEPRLMVALSEAGGYLVGALDGDQIVAAAVGFPRHPTGLHSHITGVLPASSNRGVGTALKLHQRAWCLARGIPAVTWTFDPLVARNAHLNLTRLGATVEKYLIDVYGPMNDALNRDDPSDRLLVRWDLAGFRCGEPDDLGGEVLVDERDGVPVSTQLHRLRSDRRERLLVAVPPDIEFLRRKNPEAAKRWRSAVREAMSTALDTGWVVDGFDRDGRYVLKGP
jgi:predicted GNAT superfamily acetyltransferase